MKFSEKTKVGFLLENEIARKILEKHVPSLFDTDSVHTMFLKLFPLDQTLARLPESLRTPDILEALFEELSQVEIQPVDQDYWSPIEEYEEDSIPVGSAKYNSLEEAEKWGIFEIEIEGPSHGNPFVDVALEAEFQMKDRVVNVTGFYDGEGIYRVRYMPDTEGVWSFKTKSNARSLDGIQGNFTCTPASKDNHGPVRVANTFHFAYEDGTPYLPIGTTSYAWISQDEKLIQETLKSLEDSPFNKIRMCVFPKHYLYNKNEPTYYAFEGSVEEGWDFTRFNPLFFKHLEDKILRLGELGIEADIIIFHPYDRWGFSDMKKGQDDRYLNYLVARLSAFRNVWWSLANEYDLMWNKDVEDWERFASIISNNDPYGHLRSIHNCLAFYDYHRPWITHCSVQRIDVYKTAESTNDWRNEWNKPIVIDECAYEGNVDQGWGNITGEEMVRRFWEGAVRGGYVGHGETYMHPEDIIWWAKGGKLHGTSPERIAFLKQIMEESPAEGLNPLPSDWDLPCAGIQDEYQLYYFGFNRPSFREFRLNPDIQFQVEVIDTWNMTIEKLEGVFQGTFRIDLPSKQFMAIRMTKINS